jgi:hypothetical protein
MKISGMDRWVRRKGAIGLLSHYRVALAAQQHWRSQFFAVAMEQNIEFKTCLPRSKQTIGFLRGSEVLLFYIY